MSICSSLSVRGWESLYHCSMYVRRELIEIVLLGPCLNIDLVSKTQHGCMDCLTLMISVELQGKGLITTSIPDKIMTVGMGGKYVVSYVINLLCTNKNERTSTLEFGKEYSEIVVAGNSLFFFLLVWVMFSLGLTKRCQKLTRSPLQHNLFLFLSLI